MEVIKILDNETFKKMHRIKEKYSRLYSEYYEQMYLETSLKKYEKSSLNIVNCFHHQHWNQYEKNKILDNIGHYRCRNRFCLNCQIMQNSYQAHKMKPLIKGFIAEGYKPLMLTLTVPNCKFTELKETITKMNKAYNKLFKKFNADDHRKWNDRLLKIYGSIKFLEITVNNKSQTFHPHFHILILVDDEYNNPDVTRLLEPKIQGQYSVKLGQTNMHSDFSLQLTKVWSMLYQGIKFTKKNYENWSDDVSGDHPENFVINLQPFTDSGIYELCKYTIKLDEIYQYDVFRHLVLQLERVRRIQCSGICYGLLQDLDEEDSQTEGDVQELNLIIEELPQLLETYGLEILYTKYEEYEKKYRRNTSYDRDFIKDSVKSLTN